MIVGDEKITEVVDGLRATLADDEADLLEVDEVMLVVAIHYGAAEDRPDAEVGSVFYYCTSARPHVQFGLLRQVDRAITREID